MFTYNVHGQTNAKSRLIMEHAIARVNRVFHDKPGGLVVDPVGLTDQLQQAIRDYIPSSGKGDPTAAQLQAIDVMQAKYAVGCSLFYGFDWLAWTNGPQSNASACCQPLRSIFSIWKTGWRDLNQADD